MSLVSNLTTFSLTIANGTSLSPSLSLGALRMVGIVLPSSWTTANLTFQMSPDGGTTWVEVQDGAGNAVSVTAAANIFAQVNPQTWMGINQIKIRSGTSGVPVNQGADRVLTIIADSGQW